MGFEASSNYEGMKLFEIERVWTRKGVAGTELSWKYVVAIVSTKRSVDEGSDITASDGGRCSLLRSDSNARMRDGAAGVDSECTDRWINDEVCWKIEGDELNVGGRLKMKRIVGWRLGSCADGEETEAEIEGMNSVESVTENKKFCGGWAKVGDDG
ncbi:hypothetical protein RYX36_027498 [Vicia faba]